MIKVCIFNKCILNAFVHKQGAISFWTATPTFPGGATFATYFSCVNCVCYVLACVALDGTLRTGGHGVPYQRIEVLIRFVSDSNAAYCMQRPISYIYTITAWRPARYHQTSSPFHSLQYTNASDRMTSWLVLCHPVYGHLGTFLGAGSFP